MAIDQSVATVIQEVLESLFAFLGVTVGIEVEETATESMVFNLSGADASGLIGRQGSGLHALQIITQLMVVKRLPGQVLDFSLDIDDYRRKRDWYLKQGARAAAEQAQFSGRVIRLEPMPHYERRLVHTYLQNTFPGIDSTSEGREPNRFVVVKARKNI
jgi:spoIIIJ-associated protein